MFGNALQQSMIKMGVDKLKDWIVNEKKGNVVLNITEVNNWLKENKYDFKLEIYNLDMVNISYTEKK